MSDSVFQLIAVQRGLVPTVQPNVPALFEPPSAPVLPTDETQARIDTFVVQPLPSFASQPLERNTAPTHIEAEPYRGNMNPPVLPENPSYMTDSEEPIETASSPSGQAPRREQRTVPSTDNSELTIALAPRITVIQQHTQSQGQTVLQPILPANSNVPQDTVQTNSPVAPIVQIRIGQVHVRATHAAPSRPPQSKSVARKQSLNDYLDARDKKKS
jgi:hypothetical protein